MEDRDQYLLLCTEHGLSAPACGLAYSVEVAKDMVYS